MKGCIKNELTAERESCPANDHTLLAKSPIVQCSGCTSATAVGPTLHLPVPSTLAVAVGIKKAGPTPQISFPGFAGTDLEVAETCSRAVRPGDVTLIDHRENGARDEVPLPDSNRNHRLDIHDILIAIEVAYRVVQIVLERKSAQVRNGILNRLGQACRFLFIVLRGLLCPDAGCSYQPH